MYDSLIMSGVNHTDQEERTLLEVVLQVHGNFRRQLAPLGVTPLQAGVMLYLQRHLDAKMKDTAAALGVQPPTVTVVINDLVRKHWVIRQRALHDDRAVCLRLSRQGIVVARKIKSQVDRCETDMGRGNVLRMGQRVTKGGTH